MVISRISCAFILATTAVSIVAGGSAFAAPTDYRFEVVTVQSVAPSKTDVALRLVHLPDGKPVTDAVIFENKIDMGPAGMQEMGGKVTPEPAPQPGIYRFRTETGMAGTWAMHLAAKVQGEAETVRGTVDFPVSK